MGRPKKSYDFMKEKKVGEKIVFIRKCPNCSCEVIHENRYGCVLSHRQKRNCYICGNILKPVVTEKIAEERRKKQSETMKKLCSVVPRWNDGLTKETSEILKRMGENHKGFKHSEKTKQVISKHSRETWGTNDARKMFSVIWKQRWKDGCYEKRLREGGFGRKRIYS